MPDENTETLAHEEALPRPSRGILIPLQPPSRSMKPKKTSNKPKPRRIWSLRGAVEPYGAVCVIAHSTLDELLLGVTRRWQ